MNRDQKDGKTITEVQNDVDDTLAFVGVQKIPPSSSYLFIFPFLTENFYCPSFFFLSLLYGCQCTPHTSEVYLCDSLSGRSRVGLWDGGPREVGRHSRRLRFTGLFYTSFEVYGEFGQQPVWSEKEGTWSLCDTEPPLQTTPSLHQC